jgi:transcriptional regulator with XRE-family HTH domain
MSWRLRPDRIEALRSEFREAGDLSNIDIANVSGLPQSTLSRIMQGTPVRIKSLRLLFNGLIRAADNVDRKTALNEQQLKQRDRKLREYCEEVIVEWKGDAEPDPQAVESDNDLLCLLYYIKFIHLRDQRRNAPVYRRFVPRIGQEIEVFDEFVSVRTLQFREAPRKHMLLGRRVGGAIDLQPIFPPRKNVTGAYMGRLVSPELVEHMESGPRDLSQGAYTILNGFQEGREFAGSMVFNSCDQLVLIVDMTSLPVDSSRLFTAPPVAWHIRPDGDSEELRRMSCETSHLGAFIVDSTKAGPDTADAWDPATDVLLENDRVEMRFSIDWDAVAQSAPQANP